MTDVEARLTQVLGGWAAGSVAAGAALCVSARTRGSGRQGVLVQGAFLLVLDLAAAQALR